MEHEHTPLETSSHKQLKTNVIKGNMCTPLDSVAHVSPVLHKSSFYRCCQPGAEM